MWKGSKKGMIFNLHFRKNLWGLSILPQSLFHISKQFCKLLLFCRKSPGCLFLFAHSPFHHLCTNNDCGDAADRVLSVHCSPQNIFTCILLQELLSPEEAEQEMLGPLFSPEAAEAEERFLQWSVSEPSLHRLCAVTFWVLEAGNGKTVTFLLYKQELQHGAGLLN